MSKGKTIFATMSFYASQKHRFVIHYFHEFAATKRHT